jgi:hypothetical protein
VEQISRIGMDTSKHIFQLHGVNTADEPVLRKKLRRKEMFAFLEKLAPTVSESSGQKSKWRKHDPPSRCRRFRGDPRARRRTAPVARASASRTGGATASTAAISHIERRNAEGRPAPFAAGDTPETFSVSAVAEGQWRTLVRAALPLWRPHSAGADTALQ